MTRIVYVTITHTSRRITYHTRPECKAQPDTRRISTSESEAAAAGVAPCARCVQSEDAQLRARLRRKAS